MIRIYPSDPVAAKTLAPPRLVKRLEQLGFSQLVGLDLVSQTQIGNMLAMGHFSGEVIAFVSLTSESETTFGTLLNDGGLVFTSNAYRPDCRVDKAGYLSQKLHGLRTAELLEAHLNTVAGRASTGHNSVDYALGMQRRHSEVNEARRGAALLALFVFNLATVVLCSTALVATGQVFQPLAQLAQDRFWLALPWIPAMLALGGAIYLNLWDQVTTSCTMQNWGFRLGYRIRPKSLDQTVYMGRMIEVGR